MWPFPLDRGEPKVLLVLLFCHASPAFHSHPLELVGRLFLNQPDVLQDAGDVFHPPGAASRSCHQPAHVHLVVWGRQHQLQEAAQRLGDGLACPSSSRQSRL